MGADISGQLRPMVDLTPESCAEIRKALGMALGTFARWGIVPSPGSWVQQADRLLASIVGDDIVGTSEAELRTVSSAVHLIVDIYHISTCLGDEPHPLVVAELRSVLNGNMAGSDDSKGHDFLSQFWSGALLAQSQLTPTILTADNHGKRKPDFVIQKDGVRFAVENKRPRNAKRAVDAVKAAGEQIKDFGLPGMIIVDATLCTGDVFDVVAEGEPFRQRAKREVAAMHRKLSNIIESRSRSELFSHTALLLTLGRFWSWNLGEGPVRDAGLYFHITRFDYIWSTEVTSAAANIQGSLARGVEQLTGNKPVVTGTRTEHLV